MQILVESGFVNAKQLLSIDTDLKDVHPSFAMDALRRNVEQFSFMVNQREQRVMNMVLDTALDQGWTPKQLSTEIAQTFAEGYHVLNDAGQIERVIPTDTWSDMVARTELSRAQTMGNVALYQAAHVEKVMWVTTQGANVCDECEPFDGEIYDVSDIPDGGPPLHPNCACALMAADEDIMIGDDETLNEAA